MIFESKLAEAHWPRADLRDPQKTYNPMTLAELGTKAPGFDWAAWLSASGLPAQDMDKRSLIVGEPSAITGEARVLAATDMDTLRAWLAFHLVENATATCQTVLSRPGLSLPKP